MKNWWRWSIRTSDFARPNPAFPDSDARTASIDATLADGTVVLLRRAAARDAGVLTECHRHAWYEAYTGQLTGGALNDRWRSMVSARWMWEALLKTSPGTTWLAFDTATASMLGFATTSPPRNADVPVDLELTALYTRQSTWGTGLGALLLETALEHQDAYLWVLDTNIRAQRFYTRHGFVLDHIDDDAGSYRTTRMTRQRPTPTHPSISNGS